ncbi:MAG: hypothetical protein KAR05_03445 [Candidatus Omnitrophica bacterium]|nr:hypothetical protein [Candidatus Omnitrophota bacterium]
MLKCPYCCEELTSEVNRCVHCSQFLIDDIIHSDFPSLDKKKCVFCGKKILSRAKICKHCHKWLDELDQAVRDVDPDDLV